MANTKPTSTSFKKGDPRAADAAKKGSRKGIPNKLTSMQEGLDACGFDFWDGFHDDFNALDNWQRMAVRKWLADFIFVKPVALPTNSDDKPLTPEDEKLLAKYVGDD